jgi:hypothetical protein
MTDHQQRFTETQALAWLHGQPDGTIATTVSDLARTWAGTGRRRRGASRHGSHLVSSCAHPGRTVVPYSQRGYPMCHSRAMPRPPSPPHQQNPSSFQL